jgi:hypothetical protein
MLQTVHHLLREIPTAIVEQLIYTIPMMILLLKIL